MSGEGLIVLAAGGTGGHVFPAEALAAELRGRGRRLVLVTDKRAEQYEARFPGVDIHVVPSAGVAGRGVAGKVKSLAQIGRGTLVARPLLRQLDAACVVGFGGYPSLPAMLAGQWLGLPTVLHEQNAVLGRANRLVAGRAAAIAASFDKLRFLKVNDRVKVNVTGNPVRPAIVAARDVAYSVADGAGPFRILVMGGSLGATVMSDVVPAALAALAPAARTRLQVTQQARAEDVARVRTTYDQAGIEAFVAPFIEDVPARLAACHLAISRSGASTVAELAVAGRPAVLVPYPHATDDHQTDNAAALTAAGAAVAMPQPQFTAAALAGRITDWMADPAVLGRMAQAARDIGRPDAAANLADLVEGLANGSQGSRRIAA